MAFALTPERERQVDDILTRYPERRAALLPVLWLCQRQNGWISPEVVDYAADRLGLSTATVRGVVTFYTMFFDEPVGENVVWVCRTLVVRPSRAEKRSRSISRPTSVVSVGHTSSDGKFTLLKAECLAACGQAPMIQINDYYYEEPRRRARRPDHRCAHRTDRSGRQAAARASRYHLPRSAMPQALAPKSSAPPPPSAEAVRVASQPPPPIGGGGSDDS